MANEPHRKQRRQNGSDKNLQNKLILRNISVDVKKNKDVIITSFKSR